MNLCLNMIVKNESARIERCLASVAPYINSYVIADTGSVDNTKEKITAFFKERSIPGAIYDVPFQDWSQARNAALALARYAPTEPDYYLLMDADMELVVKEPEAFAAPREGESLDMWQHSGSVHYLNRRLVAGYATGHYVGVTHEYLDIAASGMIPETVAYFKDHADGANRPEKFKRDIKLLKAGLKKEPDNVRYFFYLACSYRDAGDPTRAALWFQRRIKAGGWDEEVWQAQVNLAHCYKDMGNEAEFVRHLLAAYNLRPTRAEPMYDLAHWYREQPGSQAAGLACAEAVAHLPKSSDALFVNDFVYRAGIKEEIVVCAWYVPGKKGLGYRTCAELAQQKSSYYTAISTARHSLYHYLPTLHELCPSFNSQPINFVPPAGWSALNPSVCLHHEALHVNVRCVNYRMDEEGRYLIRDTETGDITNDNPIKTRNFVLYMGNDPFSQTHPWEFECQYSTDLPSEFPLVLGFEDMRIWSRDGQLWGSAAVRQFDQDGMPEQVLTRLEPVKAHGAVLRHTDITRMHRPVRECEKNWAPIVRPAPWPKSEEQLFMWRPGVVINESGSIVQDTPPGFATDNISGSSQVIPWKDGFLAVVHTAQALPGKPWKRYYYHRFIEYGPDLKVKRLSLPFVFDDKVIEFCAGLCPYPVFADRLVISYGSKDSEARIATISTDEVEKLLCAS